MNVLFTLRLPLYRHPAPKGFATVTVYDDGLDSRGAQKYKAAIKHQGRWVAMRVGPFYGAFSPMDSSDGNSAKEHVLHHIALKPGDTDAEFFKDYTPEQLEFVKEWSDEITMISMERYGEI